MVMTEISSSALQASTRAMGELGVAGCIGAACVQQKLLTPEMIRALSKTTFSILLPMFLGTSLLKNASRALDRSSALVPLVAVLHCWLLYVLATSCPVLPNVYGGDDDSSDTTEDDAARAATTAVCCAWGNAGVLPLLFAEALFRSRPQRQADCYARISLYQLGWSPFFWGFANRVLIPRKDNNKETSSGGGGSGTGKFRLLKQVFPPPVVGSMLGMLLSPLSRFFVTASITDSSFENAASPPPPPPLALVYSSFQNLGRAANPLALLVLTSSLAMGATSSASKQVLPNNTATTTTKRSRRRREESVLVVRQWATVSLMRFVVSPLVMWGLLHSLQRLGWIQNSAENPMLWFVLLLESCMPPAQNSVLMLQVAELPNQASALARFLSLVYATGMLPVVLIVTLALQKLDLA